MAMSHSVSQCLAESLDRLHTLSPQVKETQVRLPRQRPCQCLALKTVQVSRPRRLLAVLMAMSHKMQCRREHLEPRKMQVMAMSHRWFTHMIWNAWTNIGRACVIIERL